MASRTVQIDILVNSARAVAALGGVSRAMRSIGSEATYAFGGLGSSMGGIAGTLTGIAASMAAVATAATVTAGVVSAKFEESMLRVKAVVMQDAGFTEEAFAGVTAAARQMAVDGRYSANEVAQGLKNLAQAGYSAGTSIRALGPVMDLATVGEVSVEEAADTAVRVLSAFGGTSQDLAVYLDKMNFAAAKTATSIHGLAQGMKFAAPIAALTGRKVGEVSAALGILAQNGLPAEMAGTGFRQVLSQLNNETGPAYTELKKFGMTMEDLSPRTHSVVEISQKLNDAVKQGADTYKMFGQRGGAAGAILAANAEALAQLTDKVDSSNGSLKEMADTINSGVVGSFKQMVNAMNEVWLSFGDAGVLDGVASMVTGLRNLLLEAAEGVKVLGNAFRSGDFGEIMALSLKLGILKAMRFLSESFDAVLSMVSEGIAGTLALIGNSDFWMGLFAAIAGLNTVMVGVAIKFGAALVKGGESLLVKITQGFLWLADKFGSSMGLVVAKLSSGVLGVVEELLRGVNEVSSVFGLDLADAISGVSTAKGIADQTERTAQENLGKGFGSYEADARAVVATVGSVLDAAGNAAIEQGKQTLLKVADGMGGIFKGISEPGAEEAMQKRLDALWEKNKPKALPLPEDTPNLPRSDFEQGDPSTASRTGAAVVASSLQEIGGGGGAFGSSMESVQNQQLDVLKTIAQNTAVGGKTVTPLIGGDKGGSSALSVLTDMREYLKQLVVLGGLSSGKSGPIKVSYA